MNRLSLIAIAALLASFAVHAQTVAPAAKVAATTPPATTAAPVKTALPTTNAAVAPKNVAGLSQQDKMRECNKQATGKKGAERKGFMKTCLSKKA